MNYCRIKGIAFLMFLFTLEVSSQIGGCGTLIPSEGEVEFTSSGGTEYVYLEREFCPGTLSLFYNNEAPDWLEDSRIIGDRIDVVCKPNDGTYRTETITINVNGNVRTSFRVYQNRSADPNPPPPPPPAGCQISGFNGHAFGVEGGTVNYPLTFSNCNSNSASFSFKGTFDGDGSLPGWFSISSNGTSITVSCSPNYYEERRSVVVLVTANIGGNDVATFGTFIEQETCLIEYYPDGDGDGLGDRDADFVKYCPGNEPSGWVDNNDDFCPLVSNSDSPNGCSDSIIADDLNWIHSINKDRNGRITSDAYSYYDDLGKNIQNRTVDMETKKIWYSNTLYDEQGRAALTTLSAPSGSSSFYETGNVSGEIGYNPDFIKNEDNDIFTTDDLGTLTNDPSAVSNDENTLGWYYSENNDSEAYQDKTERPYSRSFYSELNPGTVIKTIGGNPQGDEWKQGYSFTMPASGELAQAGAFGKNKYYDYQVLKTVIRDVHGIENVVFTDTDGNTLATARSGNQEIDNLPIREMSIKVGIQGYVDIHIPIGCSGVDVTGPFADQAKAFDLITEEEIITSLETLPPGFYRIEVPYANFSQTNVSRVSYKENYYDYTLNYYDKANRLVKSTQPLSKELESLYEYNTLGQLIYTKSPDEGESWFRYRKDGQIRFSQNSKQLAQNKSISFTDYDDRGRPVESGVFYPNIPKSPNFPNPIEVLDPDAPGLSAGFKSETVSTVYDQLSETDKVLLSELRDGRYTNPSFLSGNVAKTWNYNTATYYSYDVYDRVKWIVQEITGLGTKTIDYEYDDVTSQVNKVTYQKGESDQFIHKYDYDPVDYSLIKVETSTDNVNFDEHATYEYYETGALKRVNLAEGLQGIDYVYNLAGQLKSINHPDLDSNSDPGNDANDLFGMNLHYYNGDYLRNTTKPIPNTIGGIDQYNGNIKAITWHNGSEAIPGGANSYYYDYNRNNWLKGAGFNNPDVATLGTGLLKLIEIRNQLIETSETVQATRQVKLTEGFRFTATTEHQFVGRTTSSGNNEAEGGDYDVYGITYDANGNIQTLNRNKDTHQGSNMMDLLSYTYDPDKPNQLKQVVDAAGDVEGADDIDTQQVDNYEYNAIGQLVHNKTEDIYYFYNASGLVTEIKKGNEPVVKFFYNDKNHRVRKESYNPTNGALTYTEYYVRDTAGTAMAIYRKEGNTTNLVENTIYGASRLGIRKPDNSFLYQLTDHLGNVRAVIARDDQNNAIALTATDYYPFGMPMPGRNSTDAQYRYGYQGQEVDPETGKPAFELRLWDARIGRWLTTDPYGQYSSPYLGMGNDPVNGIDPDGGWRTWFGAALAWIGNGFRGSIFKGGGTGKYKYGIDGLVGDGEFENFSAFSGSDLSLVNDNFNGYSWNNEGTNARFFGDIKQVFSLFDYFKNKSSGSKIYGSGSMDDGRKVGRDGEIYGSIDSNDIIKPGNPGGRFDRTTAVERFIKGWRIGFNIEKNLRKTNEVLNRKVLKEIDITVYRDGIGKSPNLKPATVDQAKKDAVKAMQGIHKPDSVVLEYIYETTIEALIYYPYQ